MIRVSTVVKVCDCRLLYVCALNVFAMAFLRKAQVSFPLQARVWLHEYLSRTTVY